MLKSVKLKKLLFLYSLLSCAQLCIGVYFQNSNSRRVSDLRTDVTFEEKQLLRNLKGQKPKRQTLSQNDITRYNKTYQACTTPKGEAGHCKISQSCPWNELQQNPSNIFDYLCVIEGLAVGVCCPDNLSSVQPSARGSSRVVSGISVNQAAECGINGKSIIRNEASQPANPKDWPWMAVLLRKIDYYNFCGGVLLNRRFILTAAHCVFRKTIDDFYVRLGEYDFTTPNETVYTDFNVTELRMHPDYDPATNRHDIAVLKLARVVQYNTFIRPVCLPTAEPRTNTTVIVAGWGTIFYGGPVSDVLMEVPVPVWDINQCALKYAQPIFNTNLCAAGYEGGKDSCQGDSGGPLLMQTTSGRWIVVGIVSWGISCGEIDQPGVYTKVEPYLNWIGINTQDTSP